jgi:hypothetical protein
METIKFAGVAWSLLYFGFGVISSFTLNGIDFWSSITLLAFTFIFPFPLAIVGFWYPKSTGIALLLSTVLCVTLLICSDGVKDTFTASPGIRFYIPHVVFAVAYLISGSVSTKVNSGSET